MKLLSAPVVLHASFSLGGPTEGPDRELWLRVADFSSVDDSVPPDRRVFEFGFYMQDQADRGGLRCSGFIGLQLEVGEDVAAALEGVFEVAASAAVGEIGHAVAATGIVPMGAWPTSIVIYDPDEDPAGSKQDT